MFKNFTGFNLVEQMHRLRQSNRFNPAILKKKSLGLIFVALTVLVLWFLPTESFGIDGLTPVQQRIIAIFVYATLMWVLELVPAWATSVSIIVFLLLCASDSGIKWICNPATAGPLLSYKQVMASFADPVVMLFIGGFVLAIATTKTGLDVHLARVLLTPFGKKSENILLGFMLVTALFSMFISNTATTAMMLTFLTPVFKQLPEAGKGRTAMALSIPIAANLGGMGTPIGTPPNTIALKYLNDPEGLNLGIGFGQWMLFMVPLVIVMILIAWMLLRKFFPFTQKTIELKIDGEMKRGRETTLVIVTMVVTILLWMMDTVTGINTYTVALVPHGGARPLRGLRPGWHRYQIRPGGDQLVGHLDGRGRLCPGLRHERVRPGLPGGPRHSFRQFPADPDRPALRPAVLRAVQPDFPLGHRGAPDAHPGGGLHGHGR